MKLIVILSFFLFLFSCQVNEDVEVDQPNQSEGVNAQIKYAKGFTITRFNNYKLITISAPWAGDGRLYKYVLYKDEKPLGVDDAIYIKTPIKSIACMSLTHVAFIEELHRENSIIALSGCDFVSSSNINERIVNKSIKEIGNNKALNYELLVDLNPDIVMGFGIDASSDTHINKMKTLGLQVVLNSEYMETHPLGKAEWIKFIAAFYEEDKVAENMFNSIEAEYMSLLELTNKTIDKPTVFTGMPWNGAWYVPGAMSFQAQLFKDAGANYLWSEGNDEKSSLILSKEIIVEEAYNADFWLNQNSFQNVESIVAYDEKFKGFNAVKKKNLFNNDKRLNSKSGNDYWESGVVNPQIILKDLIKIFHPEIIDHELYYYRNLN
jgi:cobalamin transport system substrate-binding protein